MNQTWCIGRKRRNQVLWLGATSFLTSRLAGFFATTAFATLCFAAFLGTACFRAISRMGATSGSAGTESDS